MKHKLKLIIKGDYTTSGEVICYNQLANEFYIDSSRFRDMNFKWVKGYKLEKIRFWKHLYNMFIK